jgi:hypothetical protein
LPEVVANQLDQERVASSRFCRLPGKVGAETLLSAFECFGKGAFDFSDRSCVKVDAVCSAQKRGDALIKHVGDCRRQAGEVKSDRQAVADEVLHVGRELGQLRPISGMDLVNSDDQASAPLRQQTEKF